jgi:CRISPR-associated protein Csy2
MSAYLVIPSMRVQAANIVSSQIAVGGPPVTAALLFAHAMALKADLGVEVLGVALIHHSIEPLGQRFYGVFFPQQRRAAALTFSNRPDRDYSSKNKQALSLQPTASAHLRVSLIVELDGPVISPDSVKRFLSSAKFSGGVLTGHDPIVQFDDLQDALESIRSGFAVLDRRDLLEQPGVSNPAEAMVEMLGTQRAAGDENAWLSATCVGYAAITEFAARQGAREGFDHAFAEPLVGLVQFRSLRSLDVPPERLIWRSSWVGGDNQQQDVFVLQQDLG